MKLTRLAAAAGLLVAVGAAGLAVAGPASAYPAGTVTTATISATVFNPGGAFSVTVRNATPGTTLTGVFQSTPVALPGSATVANNGTATFSSNVPANATAGQHDIIINSTAGATESFTFRVTVLGSGGGNGTGQGGGNGGGGGLANTGAAVTGIGILGGVLVAGGVFFVVAGRRRTANQTPSV